MARVVLIHWNAAEGRACVEALRAAGHETTPIAPQGVAALRAMRNDPPNAIVIDLSRLPSQGGAVAIELRRQKGTRGVPIVFAGGNPDKAARVRELLPDAFYSDWDRIGAAIARAIANAPRDPCVPDTMAGYSGRPLAQKLGIRPGRAVALLGAPEGFERKLGTLPAGVTVRRDARAAADLVLLFAGERAALERRFPSAARMLNERGGLWIAWPKKASGIPTDLTEREVRAFGLAAGFVDYKICAIDGVWSGLLFARRRG